MEAKRYITPNELTEMSFKLGAKVYHEGFVPDYLIALWRGGAQIGCHVHELFKFKGISIDHIAVRTSSYVGTDNSGGVTVHALRYVTKNLKPGAKILIVDDVFESGKSVTAVLEKITKESGISFSNLDIRIATLFYKPKSNRGYIQPTYYLTTTDSWLVFPHEVEGMDLEEIRRSKGENVYKIFEDLVEPGDEQIYIIWSQRHGSRDIIEHIHRNFSDKSILFENRERIRYLVRGTEEKITKITDDFHLFKLNVERYLPPWIRYPDIPRYDTMWRMGYSEDYWHSFWNIFKSLPLNERSAFQKNFPEPKDWEGVYADMTSDV